MRTHYRFIQTYLDEVEEKVNDLAQDGYRVVDVRYLGEQVFVVMMAGG